MKYVYLTVFVLMLGMMGVIYFLHKENQHIAGQAKVLEAANESQKKKIDQYARRPRTDDDVVQRLCQWAANIDREQGAAKRVLPRGACNRVP